MMSSEVTQYNFSKEASARYTTAAEAGIGAAGQFFLKQLQRAYTNYYTTQRFRNTIFIRDSLKAARPEKARKGWYTMVGVPSQMVVPRGQTLPVDRGLVALGWEIGHYNAMIGKKVQVPIAVPAAARYSKQMVDTFARVVKRAMEAK